MSGLLPPDRGEVHVDGSMSALLELGLGFSAELTVRENVELYAAVLGYPRREVKRRVEEAIQFAGLERFRDAKLKNLSTGMRARLGFATALQAESDILLLDEILAVGDADFQLKCLDVFERVQAAAPHDRAGHPRPQPGAALLRRAPCCSRTAGSPPRRSRRGDSAPTSQSVGQAQAAPAESTRVRASAMATGAMRCQRGWIEDESGQPIGRAALRRARIVVVALSRSPRTPMSRCSASR